MAKLSTRRERELFDHLRASGLRKSVAEQAAKAVGTARSTGKGTPKAVQNVVKQLRAAATELEDRAKGGPAKRQAAAKKAAATRKRQAAKRSAAAKKGARTRAKAKT